MRATVAAQRGGMARPRCPSDQLAGWSGHGLVWGHRGWPQVVRGRCGISCGGRGGPCRAGPRCACRQPGGRAGALPTAWLDARGEADFFDRFLDITHGTTTLIISHRFSTVRRADHICVLDEGRVLEQGDHESLIAAGNRYAQLFSLQAARFEDAPDSAGMPE